MVKKCLLIPTVVCVALSQTKASDDEYVLNIFQSYLTYVLLLTILDFEIMVPYSAAIHGIMCEWHNSGHSSCGQCPAPGKRFN